MIIGRRHFVAGVGAVACALPFVARAQSTSRIPTIGILWHAGNAGEEQPYFDSVVRGFHDLGYVEGHNIRFEHRFPNETPDHFRQMAAELVALKVDAIITVGNATVPYARNATVTIPIVFLFVADPVASKLVNSLAQPGGNITGLAQLGTDLIGKRFELLREIVPQLSRAALLFNPAEPSTAQYLKEAEAAATALRLNVLPFELRSLDEIERVFERMAQAGVQALTLGPSGLLFQGRSRIHEMTVTYRLPTCGWSRETLLAGLLLSYGPDQVEMAHHAPVLVDKILHGAKPADIPVEQPIKFQFIANQKAAKALNIVIPEPLLLRADEIIE